MAGWVGRIYRRINQRVMAWLSFFVFVALFFLPGRGEGRKLLKLDETKITCRSFFYNTQVNNDQVSKYSCLPSPHHVFD
jgi:hypothetical protein